MRILGITDIHGRISVVEKLAKSFEKEPPDLIMIAGDLTNFQGREAALRVLDPILSLEVPTVAVFGNCDGRDVPELLDELGIGAHNRRIEVKGLGIVGIGGSNITPFNTVWELSEEEIDKILRQNYMTGDLILSHVPPYGTKADRISSGLHVGSKALRKFIEEEQPPLVLTGHIHEARSVDMLGETLIVNPGPLFRGYYSEIRIENGKASAELKRL
ncbi:metallophosphoesterase [Thermococcus gorgonarius]|uniref:Metallophosphoesterase n=1 Tax=Thermococcus gorgonarius TaxID=71997 RepID=A0A2Z2M8U8_THEGO|nr:metallophosphoesterase [Thermococcus gorgonarius]ASJ00905.1 metallophosphoesterase [Thermococcus gorgonarius]